MTGKPKWGLGRCIGCADEIDPAPLVLDWSDGSDPLHIPVTVCPACMETVREAYGLTEQTELTRPVNLSPRWDDECPPRFQDLILAPAFPASLDTAAISRVARWNPADESKGLALRGPSGAGKTTALWSLFRNLERAGRNPKFLTGVELNRILARASRDLESVEWLWKTHLLIVDDFGKEKHSPGASSLLWEVLDRRYQNKLPILLSTRFNGAEIRARFADFTGDDIVRRLNASCNAVTFHIAEPASDPGKIAMGQKEPTP